MQGFWKGMGCAWGRGEGGYIRAAVVFDEDDVLLAGPEELVEIAQLAALACARLC